MAGYSPLKITGMSSGLVQERQEFLLPDDAYPRLQNAYVWREKLLRKYGYQFLGRLQRNLANQAIGSTGGGGNIPRNLITTIPLEPTAQLVPGTVIVKIGGITYTDNGLGVLVSNGIGTGTVNYATTDISILGSIPATAATVSFGYYPGLPVMGIRRQELQNSANDDTIFFDQKYAYKFNNTTQQFQEFIPGTTWNASNAGVDGVDFFWSTNYWISDNTNFPATVVGSKLFWVTNNTGKSGAPDPIRITDNISWLNFQPPGYGQIDATNFLVGCLAFLPFRGRLVTFNTYEGIALVGAAHYSNRIRWSTIGNPFIPFSNVSPAKGSWRDDIRGQGGFLDIPTSEDIVSVGFVRDNLIVYCERSTWQLRYTGRSIAPFQIERVNSELGVEGTFSSVQFDTSLVGVGDKGVVECDSYKSERIDIKIPDLVFKFNEANNGQVRVHGFRDFPNRLAYWTFPQESEYDPQVPVSLQIFCNQRLVYNYENDSWAIFNDSLTCLGEFQQVSTNTSWVNIDDPWKKIAYPWINQAELSPLIVGGNQQGFIEVLDQNTVNDESLYISGILGDDVTPNTTIITSPNHNMSTGFVIGISGILSTDPFISLNDGIYGIILDLNDPSNKFELYTFDATTGEFSTPVINAAATYLGGAVINIRENFSIKSKKFNFLDQGQGINFGYIDMLMQATTVDEPGAISMNVYLDYNDSEPSNTVPKNDISDISGVAIPDTFFNSTIPTTQAVLNTTDGTKFWQRVYCCTQANFITLEFNLSNAQMAGIEQEQEVQIDAQVLWIRPGARMTQNL